MLAELNAQGTTVIVVTHDMQLVTEYASHTAVVAGGRLLAHAPTRRHLRRRRAAACSRASPPTVRGGVCGSADASGTLGNRPAGRPPGGHPMSVDTGAAPTLPAAEAGSSAHHRALSLRPQPAVEIRRTDTRNDRAGLGARPPDPRRVPADRLRGPPRRRAPLRSTSAHPARSACRSPSP